MTWTRDKCPGVENSGWPGSISNTATPGHDLFRGLESSVTNRFARSLENVDFPDDFGPHTKTDDEFACLAVVNSAILLFHSPGETSS